MPFVSIRIVEGHSQERKDEMAQRITRAVSEVAGVPEEIVWVTFEDIPAGEWYIGGESVEHMRSSSSSSPKGQNE